MSDPDRTAEAAYEKLPTIQFDRFENHLNATSTIMPEATQGSLRDATWVPLLKSGDAADDDILEYSTLGSGGMAVILLARQNALMRDVAVKTLRDNDTPAARQSILNEALITGHLEHPGIIPVHMVGRRESGEPLIVMKKVEGVTWSQVIAAPGSVPWSGDRKPKVDLEWHVDVLIQVCRALEFAHSRGIIHRDIKPDNIMIGRYGEVYLLDWGIALGIPPRMPPFVQNREEVHEIVGTPAYMAPEMVAEHGRNLDEMTDVFLAGATLHHILAGRGPYAGKSTQIAMMNAFDCEPQTYDAAHPLELVGIAKKAMQRAKSERFSGIHLLREALQDYRAHENSRVLLKAAQASLDEQAHNTLNRPERLEQTRALILQSVGVWPNNPDALEVLDQISEELFFQYLGRSDLGSAANALSTISSQRATPLRKKLSEARQDHAQRHSDVQLILAANSTRVDVRHRLILGGAISLLWIGLALYKGVSRLGLKPDDIHVNHLASILPTVGIPLVAAFLARRLFSSNDFNQKVVKYFVAGLGCVALMRLVFWRFDVGAQTATALEFVVYSLIAITFALMVEPRALKASFGILAATVLAIIFPDYQFFFMAFGYVPLTATVTRLWAKNHSN
jgi:serine/threonine protein kinase